MVRAFVGLSTMTSVCATGRRKTGSLFIASPDPSPKPVRDCSSQQARNRPAQLGIAQPSYSLANG